MNEILRDREHSTIRLVMNPDKMVIGEAMRTFTYLNLYGYLTDAVIVNRVFPAEVGDYFAGWRRVQEEHLRARRLRLRSGARPSGARTSSRRSWAPRCSTGWPPRCSPRTVPSEVLHDAITQELLITEDGATLRLALPFADKGAISLKKIGLELVVGVAGQKRTIILPPALAAFEPTEATFEDGALEVRFDGAQRSSQSSPSRRGRP